MPTVIDDLSIQISAEAKSASDSLMTLERKLGDLERKLRGLSKASHLSAIGKSAQAISQAMNRAGSASNKASDGIKKIQKNINLASLSQQQFEAGLRRLRINPTTETDIRRLERALESARRKLAELQVNQGNYEAMGGGTQSSRWRQMAVDINLARQRVADYEQALARAQEEEANQQNQPMGFGARLSEVGQVLSSGFSRAKTVMDSLKKAVERVRKELEWMANIARKTVSVIKSVASTVQKLAKGTKLFGKESDASFGKTLKGIMRYGLGIRSLFVLFNKLRGAIATGFKNLAQYSDETNRSLSNLQSSMGMLKNASAVAFSPLLNAIQSQLASIIQMVAQALNAVGALMSALTGKAMTVQAVKYASDYAGSLSKGAKSAKKIKDYLLGIDELNVIHPEDDDSSGGGGGGGVSATEMFETVETPEWAKRLAELLKEAWEQADFTEVGKIVADKIAKALQKIPWGKIKDSAWRIARSFATFLNGYFSDGELAKEIGLAIGNAINTAIIAVNTFFSETDFKQIGKSIAERIHWAIQTTDFYGLGQALVGKLNSAIDFINGLTLDKNKFTEVGTKIRNAINGALDNIHWAEAFESAENIGAGLAEALNRVITPDTLTKVAETLANALNVAIGFVKAFIDEGHLTEWAKNLATSINDFFKKVKWEELEEAVQAIFDAMIEFLNDIEWSEIGQHISDLISGADLTGLWATLKGIGIEMIAWIANGVGESIARSILGDDIVDWLKKNSGDGGKISGQEMVTEYNAGMRAESQNTQKEASNVADKASQGLKTTSGGNSLTTVAKETGVEAVESFNEGIASKTETSVQAVKDYTQAVNETFQNEGNFMDGATEGMQVSWEEFMSWWDATLSAWLTGNEQNYFCESVWYKISNGFKTGIEKKWKEFDTSWQTSFKKWWSTWVEPFFSEEQWTKFGTNMANGIYKGFSACVAKVGNIANGIIEAMNSAGENIANAMNTLISSYNSMAGVLGAPSVSTLSFTRANRVSIPKFFNGGFPDSGSLFWAGENGIPEMVGQMNGSTAVASGAEITGIRQAVYDSSQAETAILQMAVNLLQEIAQKDMQVNIGDEDIARANIRGTRNIGLQLRTI